MSAQAAVATATATSEGRIGRRFAALADAGRAGLVTFVTAGDPDLETFERILAGLPASGADVIEVGMPFTDPMADGPAIQVSAQRALKGEIKLAQILDAVERFRRQDSETPLLLMGYYNPIFSFGAEAFLARAREVGVDGLIMVDLPPEHDDELCLPALEAGLDFIRLATPTTDEVRLPTVLHNARGFLYYVSITGITGTRSAVRDEVAPAIARIREHSDLPIAVGFGIRSPEQAAEFAEIADAAVVGSAIVEAIRESLDAEGKATEATAEAALGLVRRLAEGVRSVAR